MDFYYLLSEGDSITLPRIKVFIEKLTVAQLSKKFSAF
jgi:hypothetical protein